MTICELKGRLNWIFYRDNARKRWRWNPKNVQNRSAPKYKSNGEYTQPSHSGKQSVYFSKTKSFMCIFLHVLFSYFSSSQSSSASSTDSSSSDDKIPSKSFLDTMDSSESSGSLGANNNSQCFSTASDESAKLSVSVRSPCMVVKCRTNAETPTSRKRDLFGSPLIADYPVQFVHTPSAMSPYVPVTPMRTKSFNAAMKNEDFDLSRFQFAKRSKIDLEEDKAELDVLPQESPINSQVNYAKLFG